MSEWNVRLLMPTESEPFGRIDCVVVDVGHADKVFTVECPELVAELSRLRKLEAAVRNATLSQTAWEDDEHIVLLNGKPVGATIRRHSREFDRWWDAVKEELLSSMDSNEKEEVK